jgi:hypothetical protein
VSSSEAVTPAHATTKAVIRSWTIGWPRRPGHRLAAMRELGADGSMRERAHADALRPARVSFGRVRSLAISAAK